MIEADAPPHVLQHEVIHRIQALQATAVTPAGTLGGLGAARPTAAGGEVAFDVRTDWFYALNGTLWTVLVDYLDRWPEIEARALDEPPLRPLRTRPVRPSTSASATTADLPSGYADPDGAQTQGATPERAVE